MNLQEIVSNLSEVCQDSVRELVRYDENLVGMWSNFVGIPKELVWEFGRYECGKKLVGISYEAGRVLVGTCSESSRILAGVWRVWCRKLAGMCEKSLSNLVRIW